MIHVNDARNDVSKALDQAAAALEAIYETVSGLDPHTLTLDNWLEVRALLGERLAQFDAAANKISKTLGAASAQGRMLRYLQNHLGQVVNKDALSGVSGIYEWARRVRELRVEQGWLIASSETRDDLRVGDYVLEFDRPNENLAQAWQTAKRIRNIGGSGKDRLIALLREIFPAAADKEQLAYVAKIQEWPRRIRELAEEGHQIISNVDDASLVPGEYRLRALDLLPPKARHAIKLRYEVLERDKFTCQDCGRSPRKGDRVSLQVHHKTLVSQGGTNEPTNLVTLCAICHAGQHSVLGGQTGDELADPGSEPQQ